MCKRCHVDNKFLINSCQFRRSKGGQDPDYYCSNTAMMNKMPDLTTSVELVSFHTQPLL